MKDAFGGILNLVFITLFLVIVSGILAMTVNYTKAFRMKDKIITVYDDYNGECNSACESEISEYAKKIGYSAGVGTGGVMNCVDGTPKLNLYCEDKINKIDKHDGSSSWYYHISTKINMEIPAFKNILNFRIFYIFGTTETYKKNM